MHSSSRWQQQIKPSDNLCPSTSTRQFDTESNETEYTRTLKDAQGQNNRLVVNVSTNNKEHNWWEGLRDLAEHRLDYSKQSRIITGLKWRARVSPLYTSWKWLG